MIEPMTKSIIAIINTVANDTKPLRKNPMNPARDIRFVFVQKVIANFK